MFIITARCSKRRVVKILLIFALLLSLFLALRACRHSSPPPIIAAGTNEERIAYLASLGWEVNDQPIETLSVTLGETLEEPYLSYNDLQRPVRPTCTSAAACSPRATSSARVKTASWRDSPFPPIDRASLSQGPRAGAFSF